MPRAPSAVAAPLGRRAFLRLGAAGLAAAAVPLAGCGREPLRIALHPWPGYEFLRLAQGLGWVPESQVRLVRTANFVESVAAFESGGVDGVGVTLDEALRLRDRGHPVQVVLVFDVSVGADVLLARPEVETLADLRGRRIGVEPSTLGTVMLFEALQAGGLRRADVQVVDLPHDHYSGWASGELDALVTYEPSLGRLRAEGLVPLFDSRRLPQLIVDVLAVRPDAARRRADALRTLVDAHFRALRRWQVNPVDAGYRLAPLLRVAPEQVPAAYAGLDLPDALYNRRYLTAPAGELTRAAGELARVLVAERLIERAPDLEGLFSVDYLPGAAR